MVAIARQVYPEQVSRAVYPAQAVTFDINALLNFVFMIVLLSVVLSMVGKLVPTSVYPNNPAKLGLRRRRSVKAVA